MEGRVYFALLLVLTAHQVRGPHPDDHHPPDDPHHHHPTDPHHHHPPHEHHDCHGPECELVNEAIEHIGMYFDSHLCHAFRHVTCSEHVLPNDEHVCASNGLTYATHCHFARARCHVILHGTYINHMLVNPLTIAGYGPCVSSSPKPTTSTTLSTSASPMAAAITPGSGNITKQTVVTTQPSTSISTSTQSAVTTTSSAMSMHSILGSVFCQYKGYINCGQNLNVVCGSDGNFYPNTCELLKVQCADPTLREVSDVTHCSLSP